MKTLKQRRAYKAVDKKAKKMQQGKVANINAYKQQVPAFTIVDGVKTVSQEEIAGRCMTSADMLLRQTNGAFLKLWAKPEAQLLCWALFAYHQNCMIVNDLSEADVVVEIYEQPEAPHIMGTKDDVVYLALFKDDEGKMPWL